MAAVSVKIISDGREGQFDLNGQIALTEVFRIVTDDNFDDAEKVRQFLAASAYAVSYGSPHPNEPTAIAQQIQPSQLIGKRVWTVQVNYSNQNLDNPLSEPADISWDTENGQRPAVVDRNGNWICNSAGGFYDPPVMADDSRWIAHVKKNVAAIPPWFLGSYKDAVNSDAFTLDGLAVATDRAKMVRIGLSGVKSRNLVSYRELTMSIALNPDGWTYVAIDSGYFDLDRRRLTLDDATEPNEPVLLDGAGRRLASPAFNNFVTRSHPINRQAAFAALPLL